MSDEKILYDGKYYPSYEAVVEAKPRAQTLVVAHLQTENKRLTAKLADAEGEIGRLRELIRSAPHHFMCNVSQDVRGGYGTSPDRCSCWKRIAPGEGGSPNE